MVSDYARLSQLEEEAINSAGASGKQFEKTLESMNSKITNLQNQVDTFLTQIMDSGFLKFLIDAGKYLTEFANKLTSLPGILGSISKVGLGIGIFKGGAKLVDTIFRSFTQNGKQFSGLGARIGGNIFMGIKSVFHKGKVGLQNIFGKMIDYDAVIAKNTVGMNAYSKSIIKLNSDLKAGIITQEFYEQQLRESAITNSIAATSSQAYNSVIAQGLAIKGSDLILQDQELASDTLEILSTEGLTQAKKKEMIQELINQKLRKQGLVLEKQGFFFKMKNYLALMLGNQAARAGAIANLGYASTADAAAQATNRFSKAIYKIPFLGWILAVIAALVTLISIIVKCTRTTQQSIDNADKAAERATSRMQELSNEIEGLADTFSKIQELGDSFDDLTKGSVEWTSKLIENNQYLEDLVDKYEVLQGYLAYDENGIAYFKEGYENALAIDLQKQYEKQKTSKIANEYEAARLRYQKGEIDYQDYLSAQSAYVSQGIRSKASDDASIAAANLTSITFGNKYEKVWEEQEEILKDLAREGSGFTTYNNDTLKKIGQDLGLWYLKDGDIYNDKDFQEELDLNEDDMAERIISSNTLTAIQKNTKDTADSLRQESTYIQKLAAGKWENITAKDIKDHGKTNAQEAKGQLEKQLADNKGYYIPSSSKYSQIPETLLSDDYVKDLYWKFGEYFYNEGVLEADDANWGKYTGHGFGVFSSPITMTADDGTAYTFSELFDMSKTAGGWNFDDKALVKQAAEFYQNASKEYTNMIDWGSQLGYTNLDALISTWSTLTDEEKANAAKLDFNSLVLDYSKIFGEGITNGLVNYFETSGNGKDSDFAKVLAMYANSGLKNLEEAFKGLDTTTKVSADEILDFIQVQQQLGNDTTILTDNFLKLTEGMTISADKLQEVVKGINKASRITEGKTGYDTYSKEEIDALKDAGAISLDDILRVGEDQYKVINKTAEEITRYLGIWNSKIIGIDSGNGKSLDFVKLLSSGEYNNDNAVKTFGNTGASYLSFGGEGGKSIYDIAKSISENGFVEVVTENIDNEAIAKLESAKTMWMASGQFDLAKQAEQKINELKNPPLQAGQMSFTDAKEAYKAYLYQQQVITQGIIDSEVKDKLWRQISAQVDQEFTTPEAIQQALNSFISDNYYENTDDYLKEQQEEFLLDAGESGYRSDAARDAMYGKKDEIETARKATQLVINERNLGGAVNMVAASVNKLNPALGHSADFVKELTIAISDAQKDFEGFKTIIEEVEEDLKSSDPLQYQTAIGKIAQGLRNIGLEVDENWVGKNIKDIMDFYNGSASAANRLYQSLLNLKTASVDWGAMGLSEVEFLGIMSGLSFTAEGIGIFADEAQQNLVDLLKAGGTAADKLVELFSSIGLDLEYKYDTNGKIAGVGVVNRFLAGANYFRAEHNKNKSSNKWENSYDWLYNLTQKINEELRIREKLEKRYDRILKDRKSNEKDVIAAREKELQSLMKELDLQTEMYEKRRGEISAILRDNKDLTKYATYDFENNMVQIDWNRINKVKDEKLGGRIEKFIEKLENAENEFESAFDAIEDIYDTVQDIYDDSRQNYLDFEDRVLEAVVKQYQLEIDRLTEIDSSINDSNSKLLDSIQKSIDAQRQARQNAETEETLNDKLNQLMYKRQDATSSLTELKSLEKELEDSRQNYIDTLVDQKISELQEQNDEAAEQRQRQIELMEGQLEQAQKQGLLWDEVNLLIKEGVYDSEGNINKNSRLVQILKDLDDYNGLSQEGKKKWEEELDIQYKQYEEFGAIKNLLSENLNTIGSKLNNLGNSLSNVAANINAAISSAADRIISALGGGGGGGDKNNSTYPKAPAPTINRNQNPKQDQTTISTQVSANGKVLSTVTNETHIGSNRKQDDHHKKWEDEWFNDIDTENTKNAVFRSSMGKNYYKASAYKNKGLVLITGVNGIEEGFFKTATPENAQRLANDLNDFYEKCNNGIRKGNGYTEIYNTWGMGRKPLWKKYATGGLADFTGPAWLDGTKSSPELVLNPRDTENFIQLKDILSSIMSNNIPTITEGARTANSNFEININVDSISSDYDVDRLVERVKKDIVEDSSYRNPVVLNLLR